MFHDAFLKLSPKETKAVLEDIEPVLKHTHFDPGSVTILGQPLSFYPGYRFLDIADYEIVPISRKIVIYRPGNATILDWTNRPIYHLNDNVPVFFDEETIIDYIRFFFSHVRGPEGKLILAETVDDIPWREDPPPASRKALGKMLFPLTALPESTDKEWHLSGCLVFKDSLYKTEIIVSDKGRVSMTDQEILVDDLPVLDDVFGL